MAIMDIGFDKTKPDTWFKHEFTPYSSVSDYANSPPRGMTNPPMNLALREILCKDFVEFGTELGIPKTDWKPSFAECIRKSSSEPSSPTQLAERRQRRMAHCKGARSQMMQGYREHVRNGQTLRKGTIFSRSAPAIFTPVEDSPEPHPDWHQYHPYPQTLRPIDRRGPPSFTRTTSSASVDKSARTVHFADKQDRTLSQHLSAGATPQASEFMKTPSHTKALNMGKSMSLHEPGGKRPSAEAPGMARKGKDSVKDCVKEEDPKKKQHNDGANIDTAELDNRLREIRGNSRLHRAAVADRFVFGANASKGEPMVLGASTLNQANPGSWASDAAFLNKFHNSAIRIVNPSGLQVNKEPAKKRKKKKMTEQEQEEEDLLKMDGSSVFVARYPLDDALKALKKLRKKTFPHEVKPSDTKKAEKAAVVADVAASLKLGLGGMLLSRVRGSDEAKNEAEAAVGASGYV